MLKESHTSPKIFGVAWQALVYGI